LIFKEKSLREDKSMSARIRLTRGGRTHKAVYRIVVAHKEKPRDGRFIEVLGTYNPHTPEAEGLVINKDRVNYWLSQGATTTDTVSQLLKRAS